MSREEREACEGNLLRVPFGLRAKKFLSVSVCVNLWLKNE